MYEYTAVVGLGYVGLPFAVSLAAAGRIVVGVDTALTVRQAVNHGEAPFFEPGLTAALRALPPGRLTASDRLPDGPPREVVLCVGTPMDEATGRPNLAHLRAAVESILPCIGDETLVVVRSTVPVETCREVVLPRLASRVAAPLLAFCPERIIQGMALAELATLPQVIGAVNDRSMQRARELHGMITADHVALSSLEAAEMVKLICNAHTDLIYGFGNEVAMIASRLGLDAHELIESANLRYPRPDIARPGYVGGSCLTKDPYLLMYSARAAGYPAPMVAAARQVNEDMPRAAVRRFIDALSRVGDRALPDAKVLVCGMAYKGRPETDDVRGAASAVVADMLGNAVGTLAGHDFIVPQHRIKELGFQPMDLEDGLTDADGMIVLVDHPGYADLTAETIRARMRGPRVVLDVWGMLDGELGGADGVEYLRFGRG
jgi:UDP-N-acetyl-D-mannosaminuronic acid dehydrogenase